MDMKSSSLLKKGRGTKSAKSALPSPGDINRETLTRLEQLPNVGPAVARYFRRVGMTCPQDLVGRDPYRMYDDLCRVTGTRFDPCLLDTFIAAVRFMGGEPAKDWWSYTAERKRELKRRQGQ
jgi:hypothetical protein